MKQLTKYFKRPKTILQRHRILVAYGVLGFSVLACLLLAQLGTLVPALSPSEYATTLQQLGPHGIYQNPFNLPLKVVQSVLFTIDPEHSALATRLGGTLFGGMAIVVLAGIVRVWHGKRIALLAGLLFACSAWTLHSSRLASFDVMYLWGVVMLLGSHVALQRFANRKMVIYGSLLLWGALLFIPGMVWLLVVNKVLLRKQLLQLWKTSLRSRALYCLSILIWLPLLVIHLMRSGQLMVWLGAPADWPSVITLLKQFLLVPVYLFVHGPRNPELWLGQAPILDIATLVLCGIGMYFYVSHLKAARSQLLGSFALTGAVLVGLGGAVSLSILVPLTFLSASTGLAYLLREWMQKFPRNPVARRFGIAALSILVVASCGYNLRAYFVAWPHAIETKATFRYLP